MTTDTAAGSPIDAAPPRSMLALAIGVALMVFGGEADPAGASAEIIGQAEGLIAQWRALIAETAAQIAAEIDAAWAFVWLVAERIFGKRALTFLGRDLPFGLGTPGDLVARVTGWLRGGAR